MEFRKCQRSCETQRGWRLATVDEVRKSLDSIRQENLLNEFERARLLDGWIGGSFDELQPKVEFRSCLGYMLLIKCRTPEVCGSDDISMDLYSDVNLDEKGMKAAFFLCCEDWNYEVVYWLLNRWSTDENQKFGLTGNAGSLTDKMLKTSEEVSKVAMAFHSTRPMKRVPKTDFTLSSMRSMVSGILKSSHERIQDIESWDGFMWDQKRGDLGRQCWDEMGLTSDLARFQEFGFNTNEDWDKLADIVWYVTADTLAVVALKVFVSRRHNEIVWQCSRSQKMDDQAFFLSIMSCANQLLHKTFFGPESLWRVVKNAATKAQGNCKWLQSIMREEGFGTFSYDDQYGILSSVLVVAAKGGNANLVERLLEYGVQPLQTEMIVRKKTALHHAANQRNKANALQIASLLTREEGTGEALANYRDHKQRIPLHRAAYRGHTKLCTLLHDYHSDICAKDMDGKNPLHYAVEGGPENDEVITVLISEYGDKISDIDANTSEKWPERVSLVDDKDNNGKTPLDLAIERQYNNIRTVVRLLSESNKPEAYYEKLDLTSCVRQSSLNGDVTLVKKLLESGADPLERDSEGRTALHLAAEGHNEDRAREIIKCMLCDDKEQLKNLELARACDKYGRNVLHVAAFVGHPNICMWLLRLEKHGLILNTKDRDDQSALYYSVAGHHDNDEILRCLLYWGVFRQDFTNAVLTKDCSGTTPLHIAAERGNFKMVAQLLSKMVISEPEDRRKYVRMADVLGQTALHKAASGGHIQVVSKLLEEGAHPLEERDCDGKTALHHAVQAEKEEDAMRIAELLLNKCGEKEKSLLLYASAVGIGYAEESLESNSTLQRFLVEQKKKIDKTQKLVRLAAESGNIDMTRELLTRGAIIADIHDKDWKKSLSLTEKQNVEEVQNQIANTLKQGTDEPTLLDNLGRSAFADGLAALFLNPFVKSPITVGISGEWGMGKSSLMIQTESILLKMAAQMAFTDLLQTDDFPGSRKSESPAVKNEKLRQSVESMLGAKVGEGKIWQDSSNYEDKHEVIFKSLAVMDRYRFEKETEKSSSEEDNKMQIKIPSILTVRYNAWNYRNESEAWAGLAVEITRELESTMTVAQRLRTCWRYTWENRRRSICVDVILPCCFAIILAIWATVVLWLVLDTVKDPNVKNIKYGSFPLTLIAVVWAVVKSIMSVVKPISSQMLDYMSLPDHKQKLGYHHEVKDDINFLKKEVGRERSRLWNVLAFIWCCITFSFNDNYIPHTTIPKTTAASKDNLRMIVFVDDLDRCQENVVLQIISAVNLVLAACKINVVLGMDKGMVERAIIRTFGDESINPHKTSQDMADKYLRKIIQLPLDLPDPSDMESLSFLEEQLGVAASRKGSSESGGGTRIRNINARRKLNPKFRMGTSKPEDSKPVAGEDISIPLRVTKERDEISDTQRAGEGTTPDENQEKEARGISGYSAQDMTITIASAEKQGTGDISCVALVKKLISWFAHKHPENLPIDKTPPSDEQSSSDETPPSDVKKLISSELLLPKYSEGERDAFHFLRHQATSSRKLPREWKRFLNYHRLAWNILFKSKEVKIVAGWQVQLIAWLFVCCQWKDRIDTLIQEWDELNVLRDWITINDTQSEGEQSSGPSLRDIVEHYMEDRWPTLKTSTSNEISVKAIIPKAAAADLNDTNTIQDEEGEKTALKVENTMVMEEKRISEAQENERTEETGKDESDVNGEEGEKAENTPQQDRKITTSKEKSSEKAQGNGMRKVKNEEDDELEEWESLKQTLRRYNVSMDGIQAFQKFRFYCVPGHLHWPLKKSKVKRSLI